MFSFNFYWDYNLFLNNQFKNIPPLGKLLNPYNGFWKNAESDKINFLNNINLSNLDETIAIQYDSMLLPHIYAKNDEDLFRTGLFNCNA